RSRRGGPSPATSSSSRAGSPTRCSRLPTGARSAPRAGWGRPPTSGCEARPGRWWSRPPRGSACGAGGTGSPPGRAGRPATMTTALAKRPGDALKPDGDRYTWLEILQDMSNGQREAIMRTGVAPRFEDLAGWEFGGGNAVPLFRLLGIRKFVKGFYEG